MKTKEPLTQLADSTAAQSWKIWEECGRRLQEQYDLGLMPPPMHPLHSLAKVRPMGDGGQVRWERNR
jgi:hypothetical protein